jgi:hypothetical protein
MVRLLLLEGRGSSRFRANQSLDYESCVIKLLYGICALLFLFHHMKCMYGQVRLWSSDDTKGHFLACEYFSANGQVCFGAVMTNKRGIFVVLFTPLAKILDS